MSVSTQHRFPIVIGVVGGVASGKSTLTEVLQKHGAKVIVADDIAHDVLKDPIVIQQLQEIFGNGILSSSRTSQEISKDKLSEQVLGTIDRKKLGALVFGLSTVQRSRRKQLEAIVHPRIREIAKAQLKVLQAEPALKYIVLDAPLLIEGGWLPYCNKVVFLDTPAELRMTWAMTRGWSEQEWQQRESAQLSLGKKRFNATDIIVNTGNRECLENEVSTMLNNWNC